MRSLLRIICNRYTYSNHIQQGNALKIDPRQVVWKRCLDMNDRVLRNIVVGLAIKWTAWYARIIS